MNENPRVRMDKSQISPRRAALSAAMVDAARDVETTLDEVLPQPHGLHGRVHEAMRYATFAGGKRLRPFLVLHSARLFGVPETRARRVAAAIEAMHTYSLVHDDLPCMDDDDLRRGRPTTHKAFDEATAVLAGDALLTISFEILADPATHESGEVRCRLIARLAEAAGSNGMIGGQMIDMQAPSNAFNPGDVIHLQRLKTGALFEYACEAGAILAEVGQKEQERLRHYARDLGLAFQIADDLLDAEGDAGEMGKAAGKDAGRGKTTVVSVLGVERARMQAKALAEQAVRHLDLFGEKADFLRAAAEFVVERRA